MKTRLSMLTEIKRIDVGDALQTLQYSVGKFRKFSAQEKKSLSKMGASFTPAMEFSDDKTQIFGSET